MTSRLDAASAAVEGLKARLDVVESVRTDPPVSEAQRRAMRAAAAGRSNLGISEKVGKEFSEADPGGKLPESKQDADLQRWRVTFTGGQSVTVRAASESAAIAAAKEQPRGGERGRDVFVKSAVQV